MSQARHIREDYLSGAPSLRPFYQYAPQGPSFEHIMADKQFPAAYRKTLVSVLRDQYVGLDLPQAVEKNLEALAEPTTFTVTTGHQLGLMGGPLFTVYKVLSAIRLADHLNDKIPTKRVVPLFWIHTEDHDFEEINHFYTAFDQRISYGGVFQGAVGNHILTPEITQLIPENFSAQLRACWEPGISLADAFRRFFHELMGTYGLVILDAADPRLKRIFTEVVQQEIEEQAAFRSVNHTSQALSKAGYRIQIHPREINLFYLDGLGRNRLVAENGHFKAMDRDLVWTRAELNALIAEHPERFSPNVSLRPLYQEMILPNLAYFGGWGELSYWLQLKGVFERFGVNFPLLLPRFSATVATQEQVSRSKDLGLHLLDLRRTLPLLYQQIMPQVWSDETYEALSTDIIAQIEKLHQYVSGEVSPTLARSVDALKTKSERFIHNIHKKAYRVKRHQHPQRFDELRALKAEIQPDGLVQERIWSLGALAMSPEAFVAKVAEQCNPLDFAHRLIILEDS